MDQSSQPLASVPPPLPRIGLAVTSLVLGILAVCLSFLLLGGLLGLCGVVLGWIHLRRHGAFRSLAGWGMGLSVLGIAAACAFGAMYFQAYRQFSAAMKSVSSGDGNLADWEGVIAPDFTLVSLDGQTNALSDFRGKRVVLDFWATWCGPCRRGIPHFIRLVSETSRDELVVIGISSEDEATLRAFAEKHRINYPIASLDNLPAPYDGIHSIPTTLFVDRQGILQKVLVGYHDFDALKQHALQPDWEGAAKPPPTSPASTLTRAERPLQARVEWSRRFPAATALGTGDWDGDGRAEVLIADSRSRLHILDLDGTERQTVSLPGRFTQIECGRHGSHGSRLLGYSVWAREVTVMDRHGTKLWSYATKLGVNGAHWGDLDGDGTDELIVGLNGGGGLHAVDADGKTLWTTPLANVWNQAVVPAGSSRGALVFATEAGGTVRVFDGRGQPLHTIRHHGKYYSQMSATRVDDAGLVQVVAISGASTVAFDPAGVIQWSTTAVRDPGAWRAISFAAGDLDGDGRREWAFCEAGGDLVIATAQGEKLCVIPDQQRPASFAIAGHDGPSGRLIVLNAGDVKSYRFEPLSGADDSVTAVTPATPND